MQDELRELNQSQLIEPRDYQTALFLLKQEIQKRDEQEIDKGRLAKWKKNG